ncbi:centromere protein U isoform X1 [Podarcis lilfordi]|uniref:Centromere protein U isoform X1 n=1 Tax=Podarcis lilfordi TaxID=74358 RepID=A0AA35JU52_9SAUR|nr:centromere protein U isoform X1 [Podarcis lilfordi]
MGDLPSSQINNYESFKKLVMQRYGLHPENYRRAFRKGEKAGPTDNTAVYSAKMAQNLELWLAAEGVCDFGELKQLMLIEQLMRYLPPEIASLVADQSPRTLSEATELAESFRLNRSHLSNRGPGGEPSTKEKFPRMGQSIIMAPRTSRMAYEYQDLPQQMREASVEDGNLELPSRDSCRSVRRRSPSPVRVYSPVRAWETHGRCDGTRRRRSNLTPNPRVDTQRRNFSVRMDRRLVIVMLQGMITAQSHKEQFPDRLLRDLL